MRVNPEIYIVEVADAVARGRRQQPLFKMSRQRWFPGAKAHIETPGIFTEQERPTGNRSLVAADVGEQGKTEALRCQRSVGVGLFHSSDEAGEAGVSRRAGGAKGRAGQGTCRRER